MTKQPTINIILDIGLWSVRIDNLKGHEKLPQKLMTELKYQLMIPP